MSSDVRPFVVRRRPQPGPVVVWPLAARAQQPMPVIGYLNFGSPESDAPRLTGLRRGLSQTGYVEGRNLLIEYRWAGNQADRLPALAADLVRLRVAAMYMPIIAVPQDHPIRLTLLMADNAFEVERSHGAAAARAQRKISARCQPLTDAARWRRFGERHDSETVPIPKCRHYQNRFDACWRKSWL